MKKIIIVLSVILIFVCCGIAVAAESFSDLSSSHWAYEAVSNMSRMRIVSGYPDGTFLPNKNITKAEFSKLLVLMLDLLNDNNAISYSDVDKNHWAYQYISVVSNYMVPSGNEFAPDHPISREEAAYAIIKAMKLENSEYRQDTINQFTDKNLISSGFEKYIIIATEKGFMVGNAKGTFNPKGYLTRAEVTQLLYNITVNRESPKGYEVAVKIPQYADKIYTGKEQSMVDKSQYYTLSGTTNAINAGEYKVQATLKEGYRWSDGSKSNKAIIWKIKKANANLLPEKANAVITEGTSSKIKYTYIGDGTLKVSSSNTPIATVSIDTVNKNVEIKGIATGSATITLSANEGTNYTAISKTIKVVVLEEKQKDIVVIIPTYTDKVYTGKEQSIVGGEGYTLYGTTKGTNAGVYKAGALLKNGYQWNDGSKNYKEITWKITKANAVLTPKSTSLMLETGKSEKISYAYTGDGKITANSSDAKVATVTVDTTNKTITIKGMTKGNVNITLSANEGTNYTAVSKTIKIIVNEGNNPIFNSPYNGVLVQKYSDASIDVKIEKIDGFFVSKIWVKDPSKQLQKVDQGSDWNKKLKRVDELMKGKGNAIIACNASGFNHDPYWTGNSKYGGDWDNAPSGHIVITNGVIRRKREAYNKETLLGILKDGTLKFFKNASYDTIISEAVNTIKFGSSLLIEDGKGNYGNNSSTAPRTAFGQINKNNYVILVTQAKRSDSNEENYKTLDQITDLGLKLGCKTLFNCDGGGSSTLWFNGSTYFYAQPNPAIYGIKEPVTGDDAFIYGPRPVADAIYFISTEK